MLECKQTVCIRVEEVGSSHLTPDRFTLCAEDQVWDRHPGPNLLLCPLVGVERRRLAVSQHHPVLVAVLSHLLPAVVHGLHLRVAAQDVGHAFVPEDEKKRSKIRNTAKIYRFPSLPPVLFAFLFKRKVTIFFFIKSANYLALYIFF